MWVAGFTLNIITLLALALAVGIVIDDAIVVLENIVRFVQEKRQKPFAAAVLATQDIGLAVLATTLSLMAVFLPVAFMNGIVGRFLKSFGVTMAFSIGISLLVSFSLTPMLAARLLDPVDAEGQERRRTLLERMVDSFYLPLERTYVAVLHWIMRHRWLILVASALTLGSCFPLAGGQSTVSDALVGIIRDVHMPAGYSASPAGFTKETGRAVTGFLVAIGMSFVFMYLILAAQFGSWLHPTRSCRSCRRWGSSCSSGW